VVAAPGLQPLFGPGSRGEVPFAGVLKRPGRADLSVAGRLDRLAITDDAVLIADFKLGSAPARPLGVHVAQLALYRAALAPLYPSRSVRATLVYLHGPAIKPLSDRELDAALEGLVTL
jgi:ATP-dependent helicase/nuclease subunit A